MTRLGRFDRLGILACLAWYPLIRLGRALRPKDNKR